MELPKENIKIVFRFWKKIFCYCGIDKDPIHNAHNYFFDIKEDDQLKCHNIIYHDDNINKILVSHKWSIKIK